MRGSVSKTVTLSQSPTPSNAGVELNTFETGGALTLGLSGSEFKRTIQVPILIRSNTAYTITATVESHTAVLTQLQVLSVEATGKLVAGDAVTGFAVRRQLDKRPGGTAAGEESVLPVDTSVPFTIFTGPRISIGGGLDSPHNALKVILLLSLQAMPGENWHIDLKLQGNGTDLP